jgi:hypothetical protein
MSGGRKTGFAQRLQNIYLEGELDTARSTEDSSVVRAEDRRQAQRQLRLYNLDANLMGDERG